MPWRKPSRNSSTNLVPALLTLGEVQKVLQQLLREQVSIRDLTTILEVLLDTAPVNKSQVALVEATRQALGRSLVQPLLSEDRKLKVLTLDPSIEQEIQRSIDPQFAGDRSGSAARCGACSKACRSPLATTPRLNSMTLVCSSPARFHLRRLLEPFMPRIVVLSPAEIPATVSVQSLGMVRDERMATLALVTSMRARCMMTTETKQTERSRFRLDAGGAGKAPDRASSRGALHRPANPRPASVQVPLEDLVHAGVIGLIDAVDKFDPAATCSSSPMRSSEFAARFSIACGPWTGVRDACASRRG